MKTTQLLLLLVIIFSISLKAQVTLKIEIKELRTNNGTLLLDLLDGNEKSIKGIMQEIKNNSCLITVNDLKPGKYAFKYFHDENNNKKMDTYFIGAPKEGIGFSNDAKGKFGPPDFEKTIFNVKNDTTVSCTVYYIGF